MNHNEQLNPDLSEQSASFADLPGLRPYKIGHSRTKRPRHYLLSNEELTQLNGGDNCGGNYAKVCEQVRKKLMVSGAYWGRQESGKLDEEHNGNPVEQKLIAAGLHCEGED